MDTQVEPESVEWLMCAIRQLPSDAPVPGGTPGYNRYNTQKAHWLGWLDPTAGTGTYPRRTGRDRGARYIYNHIVEPKMLLWLVAASGVRSELVRAASLAAGSVSAMAAKSAAVRRVVPWPEVAAALAKTMTTGLATERSA